MITECTELLTSGEEPLASPASMDPSGGHVPSSFPLQVFLSFELGQKALYF